jgi:hypothetical protein
MVRKGISGLVFGLILSISLWGQAASPSLEEGFHQPPGQYGIRCFWWWLNSNVTKEAITRDLEEMKAKGFSGALIFDANTELGWGDAPVPAGPMYMSAEWRELFKHAVQEAQRLGLELSLNIQSGWNLGGPTVTPDHAAKMFTWSETTITGPTAYSQALPQPGTKDNYYRDIAVSAYKIRQSVPKMSTEMLAISFQPEYPPVLAGDGKANTFWVSAGKEKGEGPRPDRPEWLEIKSQTSLSIGGIRVLGRKGHGPKECQLEVSTDGKSYRTVESFSIKDDAETIRRFAEEIKGKCFRLKITQAYDTGAPESPRNVQVIEFSLLTKDGKLLSEREKRQPIQDLEYKAMFHELKWLAMDSTFLLTDVPAVADEEDVSVADILDITNKMDPNGVLQWDCPEGKWVVLRFGYTLSGATLANVGGGGKGFVIDYMDPQAFRDYWVNAVEPLIKDAGPAAGTTLKYLCTDSWECGGANWTPTFRDDFKKFCGYDPVPYLPIIAGKIVESRDVSNRFLADFRKTIGNNIARHYQVFADMAHQYNMGIHPESGGPHAGPFDAIKNLGRGDITMAEFWSPSPSHRPKPENRFFVKQAASAAHIYGKPLVGAEAFTTIGTQWNDPPWKATKPSFDHEACSGLNMVFFHTFTCSPKEMGMPGQEYFAGTHFNPQITWWDETPAFLGYLDRCQYLFQQGRFVADVLYYYGDHIPNLAALKESDPAKAMPGYDYDTINEEMLLKATVKDGRITLPSAMQYRILVLPDHKVLSLAALKKVDELVRQGATVLGPKPERTVSLVNWPACDKEFQTLTEQLWGQAKEPTGSKVGGQGRILWGKTARQALLDMGVAPDMETSVDPNNGAVDYIHYRIGETDVYFVCNQAAKSADAACTFRVGGKQPELWDAISGRVRDAEAFVQKNGRTTVPLRFAPYGSLFVVFQKSIPTAAQGQAKTNSADYQPVQTLDGPWTVHFAPRWGGPEKIVFENLTNWIQHPDDGIKYYSGKAVYQKLFEIGQVKPGKRYVLNLGRVEDLGIAHVSLNGKDQGIVWAMPFEVDVTGVLQKGRNALEITVVSSWYNRLFGDSKLPEDKRLMKTNIRAKKGWQLLDAGLLGPVQILEQRD